MSRVLYFEQITDSRFDTNIDTLLQDRVALLTNALESLQGVCVYTGSMRKVDFNVNLQYRVAFYITKTRKQSGIKCTKQ